MSRWSLNRWRGLDALVVVLVGSVLVVACGPAAGGRAAEQAGWKVGLASNEVTPRKPVYMAARDITPDQVQDTIE